MNFVLTGFMASGKTEISRCLAQALGYAWVDTDEQIEKKMQMPILQNSVIGDRRCNGEKLLLLCWQIPLRRQFVP